MKQFIVAILSLVSGIVAAEVVQRDRNGRVYEIYPTAEGRLLIDRVSRAKWYCTKTCRQIFINEAGDFFMKGNGGTQQIVGDHAAQDVILRQREYQTARLAHQQRAVARHRYRAPRSAYITPLVEAIAEAKINFPGEAVWPHNFPQEDISELTARCAPAERAARERFGTMTTAWDVGLGYEVCFAVTAAGKRLALPIVDALQVGGNAGKSNVMRNACIAGYSPEIWKNVEVECFNGNQYPQLSFNVGFTRQTKDELQTNEKIVDDAVRKTGLREGEMVISRGGSVEMLVPVGNSDKLGGVFDIYSDAVGTNHPTMINRAMSSLFESDLFYATKDYQRKRGVSARSIAREIAQRRR